MDSNIESALQQCLRRFSARGKVLSNRGRWPISLIKEIMATIEDMSAQGASAFAKELRVMPDEQLMAQQLVQQGAVHVLSTLLKIGCTESNVADMLASLRENAQEIRKESERRGKPALFDSDQTAFN
jgi:hypothetical protein